MKFLAKLALVGTVSGAAATLYGAPGGWLSPNGASSSTMSMTFEEMLVRTQAIHEQAEADYRRVQELKMTARKEKDVIKLNCLNDKLVLMKPELNIVEHAQVDLQGARGASEQQVAFSRVTEAGDNVRQSREAADQCVGKPLLAAESSNEFTHPAIPDFPTTDPTTGSIEPPAYASPFN